jgi:uncharacterized protein YndB with AHSA1/START domain
VATPETRTDVVQREIRVEASPETVFPYFTDPERMVRWKGTEATLDPRPGGVYRVLVGGEHVARGEYVEVVPYSRVAFTWGWEGEGHIVPPGSSTVEIDLVPDGDATIVRLTHRDLPAAEREMHGQGWDRFLPMLAEAVAASV